MSQPAVVPVAPGGVQAGLLTFLAVRTRRGSGEGSRTAPANNFRRASFL